MAAFADNFQADRWLVNYAVRQLEKFGPWDRIEVQAICDSGGVLFRRFILDHHGRRVDFVLSPDIANIQPDPELYVMAEIRHNVEEMERSGNAKP